jgi:endonuclease/exonuclease/phosphatase family metal-dependent hydrolase
VLLEHLASGGRIAVGSFHNPAETARFHRQGVFRAAATRAEIRLAHRYARLGIPLLITGDMNERDIYFCRLTGATGMHASAGGSTAGRCRPPRNNGMGIDWVFGSPDVQFIGHTVDDTPRRTRVSDHPIVVAEVK